MASRRGLFRGGAALGVAAGLLSMSATGATRAVADDDQGEDAQGGRPAPDSSGYGSRSARQFTVAIMPDTQYLFDGDSINPEPVVASLTYLRGKRQELNLVWLAHLGDLTQNGAENEMAGIAQAFGRVRNLGVGVSTLTGNHDIDQHTDDQRGQTPYLTHFRPRPGQTGLLAVSPDGYNSAWTFKAAGVDWMVLALDWRLSEAGFAWANSVLDAHQMPTILTTHDVAVAVDPVSTQEGPVASFGAAEHRVATAQLTANGQQVWDRIINQHDQIILAVGGHNWPSGRLTKRNAAGHDVDLHVADYQELYFGGGAALRLYHVDLDRQCIDVETVSPWADAAGQSGNILAATMLERTNLDDRFSVPVDFAQRLPQWFAPRRRSKAARDVVGQHTLAYWRFDQAASVTAGTRIADLSGHHNDLIVRAHGAELAIVDDSHPLQPSLRSLRLGDGSVGGDYLATVDGAPLLTETFPRGYTVEAFFRLPAQWGDTNAWSGLVCRSSRASDAGRTEDDPEEPTMTLSISGDRELQWCVYPDSMKRSMTNWGHELPLDHWWHVAVTNDGSSTVLYVDGCRVARNPTTPNRGLVKTAAPWLVGASSYDGGVDKVFQGLIGDIRISDRVLAPREFLIG